MRLCENCGRRYYRRNLLQVWDVRNTGHRDGWHQTTIRVCLTCQSPAATQRVLLATVVRSAARRRLPTVRDAAVG
jgi:hypothetical protein